MSWYPSRDRIKALKEMYPSGTRVEIDSMEDPWSTLKQGDQGTVFLVDDIGTVHVKWDSGSSLGLVYGEDKFHRV